MARHLSNSKSASRTLLLTALLTVLDPLNQSKADLTMTKETLERIQETVVA